jgi:phosphatidylethanolamine N-methyltransferase
MAYSLFSLQRLNLFLLIYSQYFSLSRSVYELTIVKLLDIVHSRNYACLKLLPSFFAVYSRNYAIRKFLLIEYLDWGDFFFLIDKNLTFDGVFEMAPHPMYSVGYAGYYGISLISNSYTVLFISLAAHAAQFIFLATVEEPHIKKIYGSGSPHLTSDAKTLEILYGNDSTNPYFRRDLIVFKNFDFFRSGDFFLGYCFVSMILFALPMPNWTGIVLPSWLFIAQCVIWRIVHTYALGFILRYQSNSKAWTRHFIKFGGTNRDAFFHWKK